jgi:hypothetical protein
MFLSAKPITDIGESAARRRRRDRRALGGGLDHRRHVGVAEGRRAGGDRLHRDARAAAFLDVEVDAFLVEVAALLAEVERRVLAVRVPVEQQRDLVLRLRGAWPRSASEGERRRAMRAFQHCMFLLG